jgi:hypothetical protein
MASNVINQDTQIIGSLELPVRLNDAGNFLQLNALNFVTYRTPEEVIEDLGITQNFVPYQDAHSPVDLNSQNITTTGIAALKIIQTDYVDFEPTVDAPAYKDGRQFYDKIHNCLTTYDDIVGSSLQGGQELRVRIYNGNGATIPNGAAVSVVGRRPLPSMALEVELAISSDEISALNTIGITTTDIPVGEEGWATTAGIIHDIDTSAYPEGAAIWLSSTVAGAYQTFRPASPSYEVRMGGIAKSHATLGEIYAELRIIANHHDNARFLNGSILEDHEVNIVKTPTTTSLQVVEFGSNRGFLSILLNQEYTKFIAPSQILLTNGTDTLPATNYVYINTSGVLEKSLTGFPTAVQFAPVATIVLQSAATANTYGPYKVHAWTDHLADSKGQGHLSHINKWIRNRPALWKSGIVFSSVIGTAQATIPVAYSSGVASQLHLHNFPTFNTATGSSLWGINNLVTPYARRTSLSPAINTDSLGGSIGNNKYYTLVLWGVVSERDADCKVMFNLPSGSYTNVTDALNDINKYNNYTIPDDYIGTGILLTQITLQRTTSTVQIISSSVKDLRGLFPASGGGGGTVGGSGISKFTELSDTPATIQALKTVRGNVAGNALEFYTPYYTHTQGVDSTTWTVAHGLNRYPSVTIIDSAGTQLYAAVKHIDKNNLLITFNAVTSGIAELI